MKILHVNTSDIQGGAARAAYRLHQALIVAGVDSQMLVQYKASDDQTVIRLDSPWQKARSKVAPTLDIHPVKRYSTRTATLFSPAWTPFSTVPQVINKLKPDIVHLHWICGGMMTIEDIGKINAPIVWSLHDNWAFTGGCHIKWECDSYQNNCGSCPRLGSTEDNDLSRKIWKRKNKVFSQMQQFTIIGLSRWLADCAKVSGLLKNHTIINLPNLLDTDIFKPIDKKIARTLLNLPIDKKLVVFGANSATQDINKGFQELSQALTHLSENIELVIFGSSKPKIAQGFKQYTHYLGHLHDDISLRLLYSAADVMIVPSLQENLSNVIMESLACETPVVAFRVGGNGDMIDHKKNGYLAKPFNPQDLAHGVEWVLDNSYTIKDNARNKIISSFESKFVCKKYINLYKEILAQVDSKNNEK